MACKVRGSHNCGARFSAHVQTGPEAPPASCTVGTGYLPVVKYGRGGCWPLSPILVPQSLKSRAKHLPTLWATTGPVTGIFYLFLFLNFNRFYKTECVISSHHFFIPNLMFPIYSLRMASICNSLNTTTHQMWCFCLQYHILNKWPYSHL